MTDESTVYIRRTFEPLKFLGRLFLVPLRADPKVKAVSYAPTWEANGEHWGPTLIFHIPRTPFALGVGIWLDAPEEIVAVQEEDAEYDAYVAVNGPVSRAEWSAARKSIAAMGLDPSEEMELMQNLGIFE
jgi:hypothetical protein